jgi:hypothetical protein
MKKLDAIRLRLERISSPDTNTDEKLENGAIMDSVQHSEADIAWLLSRVGELVEAGSKVLGDIDHSGKTLYIEGLVELRAAINRTLNTTEGDGRPSISEAVRIARGGDPSVKRHGFA